MGSRGRSIRLRIYFLVAIPLVTMLGLFAYVAYSSVTNWLNLDRAPNLVNATSEPLTNFVNLLQAERRAAVVYLSQPDAANLSAYQGAVTITKNGEVQLEAALNSAGTKTSSTPQETADLNKMTGDLRGMTPLRAEVTALKLAPLSALAAYTNVIADQGAVLQAEASSITDVTAAEQGLGLISAVNTQEDLSEQDAVLAGALARGALTPADRVAFSQAGGRLQDDTMLYEELFTPAELKTYNATLNMLAPTAMQADLANIQQAVPAGTPLSAMEQQGLSASSWQLLTKTWLHAASKAGTDTASAVLAANESPAIDAKRRVWETGAIGALGLILTLIVTILLGRSINRRLTMLRRSALTLAHEQLPAVVSRLRRGDDVDVAAEAPPLRAGDDEIGQVGQAIDAVRQTAIRSAVEEARLRQGLNDVFRNLARRNQSLLQRQLSVLDDMERRATDPDVLADLFKMDHLTTRMRRHAEGLIILSGAAPGRGWSAPVKLIDVMRGAVAEIEDYARVTVSTQSKAALAGSAVTDVIHLLAELIENATTLSPPFTQVRVIGESVGNGFAIEIEDRGLGLSAQKMAELNDRLANPPDINPANTEQLGLFVVGQLALRHAISVALRPSPYGGTTAVMLIPQQLIVDEAPAAITAGGPGSISRSGAMPTGVNGGTYGGYSGPGGNGYGADGDRYGADGNGYSTGGNGYGTGGIGYGAGGDGPGYPDMPFPGFAAAAPDGAPAGPPLSPPRFDTYGMPAGPGAYGGTGARRPAATPGAGMRISGALRQTAANGAADGGAAGGGAANGGSANGGRAYGGSAYGDGAYGDGAYGTGMNGGGGSSSGGRRGRHVADDVPVVTGVPVSRPTTPPFDVFTPLHRSPGQGETAAEGPGDPDAPYAASYTDYDGGSYGTAAHAGTSYEGAPEDTASFGTGSFGTGSFGAASYGTGSYAEAPFYGVSPYEGPYDDTGYGNGGGDGGYSPDDLDGSGSGDYKGLPRRVRQANLAPQLRSSAASSNGPAGVPRATAASLVDMRNTLSAMQRGWQQGRSQSQGDTEGMVDGD